MRKNLKITIRPLNELELAVQGLFFIFKLGFAVLALKPTTLYGVGLLALVVFVSSINIDIS